MAGRKPPSMPAGWLGRGEERRSLATTMATDLALGGVAEVAGAGGGDIEDAEVAEEEVATMVTMVLVANMTRASRDFRFYFYPVTTFLKL